MMNMRNQGSKESLGVKFEESTCAELCLKIWLESDWHFCNITNTMFPSYRIAIALFQFSYQIGFLFPLEQIFFGMLFVTERGWNAPILKVIQDISDSYRSTPKT